MSYILISFPCKSIKKYFWTNPNVILLDEEGFLKYSLKNKTREYLVNNNNFSDVSKIRQLLNWWTPVLERWQGTSILNEQKRIRYLFLINEILSILKEYNIKNVIQITAVPHHIDNLLVSIACNIELINEFTLYPNVFDGRLVPLIQKGSIFDRKVFKYKKSKINYDIIIDDFLNNYKKGNPPSINSKPNFFKTSFELTALMIYVKGVKSLFKPITNNALN